MNYIDTILNLAKDNKYTKLYISICRNAQFRANTRKEAKLKLLHVEGHHILPKCFNMGGVTDKTNYAFLTPKEHFICHRLLTRMFNNEFHAKMVFAINMFTRKSKRHNFIKITPRVYEQIKNELRLVQQGRPAHNRGIPMTEDQKNKLRGKPKSDETKAKISAGKLGKSKSPEFKKHLSEINSGENNPFFGKKHSIETKEHLSRVKTGSTLPPRSDAHRRALSEANKGKPLTQEKRESLKAFSFKGGSDHPFAGGLPEYMKLTCTHCGKTMAKGLHTRWHGDKCKKKKGT
jgi:hypothetical protein